MNPQWNTPPNGDFASYVERLTSQAPVLTAAQRDDNAHVALGDTMADVHSSARPATAAQQMVRPTAGRVPPTGTDNLLARGLLAALASLRAKLERSIQNNPRNR